ncbi:MAG: ribonuclease Z [Eubacteriales bacterium]|nr:ribonuclease Z [Eubacteriales bacterium]
MLDVCLLGTGGMMPLPDRWLTSLLTRYNGSSLLIDCGEGTQISLKKNGWTFKSIDIMCFTHFHADHISGLPGILLAMANAERSEPLTMVGPRGLARVVNGLRVIAPELPFEIRYIELTEPEEKLEINGYHITAFRVRHNMVCYGYSVEIKRNGKFDPVRAREQGIPLKYWNPLQKGSVIVDGEHTYTPDMVLGASRKGLKITYCTDTRPIPVISEMGKNADLMILEGMYGEPDKDAKAREHKHMTVYEAAGLAKVAQPARLWLTHFSPSMIHPEWYMKNVKKIFEKAELGSDGRFLELDFEDEE